MQTVGRDVSERLQTRLRLKTALQEKEILLREVYHRTRNNLQVIGSIVNIEAQKHRESGFGDSLLTIVQRINCMRLVHQMLMGSGDLTTIDLLGFARILAGSIVSAYSKEPEIELELGGDAVEVMVDEATPIGLGINELLTNSCKHAFKDSRKGRIQLHLELVEPGTLLLGYPDNGPGVASVEELENTQGIGNRLIWSLVESQLAGSITVRSAQELYFGIWMKLGGYSKRIPG